MGLIDVLTQFGFDPHCNAPRMARHKDTRAGVDFDALIDTDQFEEYQSWQRNPVFHDADFVVSFIGDGAGRARFWGVYRVLSYKTVSSKKLPKNVPWPWQDAPHFRYQLQRVPDYEPLVDHLVIEWSNERTWAQHLRNNAVLECPPLHDIDLPKGPRYLPRRSHLLDWSCRGNAAEKPARNV